MLVVAAKLGEGLGPLDRRTRTHLEVLRAAGPELQRSNTLRALAAEL
jgi:hypothetical protein